MLSPVPIIVSKKEGEIGSASQAVAAPFFNFSIWKAEQAELCEFEASLNIPVVNFPVISSFSSFHIRCFLGTPPKARPLGSSYHRVDGPTSLTSLFDVPIF